MKSATLAGLVLARLATIDGIDVLDGGVLKTPTRPYVTFFAGAGIPIQGRYSDTRTRYRWPYSVMVVNNSPQGVRILADRVLDLIHEWRAADETYSVHDYSSAAISDDEVEGVWRWSQTLYFAAHPPRRTV